METAQKITLSPARRKSRSLGWWVMAIFSLLIALIAIGQYFLRPLEEATGEPFLSSFLAQKFWLYLHISGGSIALLTGPLQFHQKFRNRYRVIHRWLGRVYLIGILIGAIGGIVIARTSPAGLTGTIGFSALALLWMYTGWQAYSTIRQGKEVQHQHWMIRNYALSLAAVTLRLYLPLGIAAYYMLPGLEAAWDFDAWFLEVYRVVPWLCWVPNLMVAQMMIERRQAGERHA